MKKGLLDPYYTSVARNSNMLLGIVVDTSGLVPKEDVARLKEFGETLNHITANLIMSV